MSRLFVLGRRWSLYLFGMIACHHHHRPDGKCRTTIFSSSVEIIAIIIELFDARRPFSPSKSSPKNKIKQNKKDKTKFAQTLKANNCLAPEKSGEQACTSHFHFISCSCSSSFYSSSPLLVRRSSKLQNKLLIQKFIRLVRENLFGHRHLIITPFFSLLFCWFHLCQHRIRGPSRAKRFTQRKMPFVVNFVIGVVITPHDSLVCNSAWLTHEVYDIHGKE